VKRDITPCTESHGLEFLSPFFSFTTIIYSFSIVSARRLNEYVQWQDQLIDFTSPRPMREVISVHVGQAGVQIGNACCKPAP
jgi:hypothetical protein